MFLRIAAPRHLLTSPGRAELSLLHVKPRAATVRAAVRTDPVLQPKLKVAVLGVAAFTRLLGSLRDIMERNARNYSGMRQG